MGYRTDYNLYIYNKFHDIEDKSLDIVEKIEKEFRVSLGNAYGNNWDNHIEDMVNFSKNYSELYFYFANKGDEQDDIWISFFHNGKYYEESLEPKYPLLDTVIAKLKCL